jgi:ribosome-binding protein aMBF1 (putative translation factor)
MATPLKNPGRKRPRRAGEDRFARLEAKITHLAAEVLTLKTEMARRAEQSPVRRAHLEGLPALPAPDAEGNYPAAEALDVVVARQIIRRRHAAGWSQVELAQRAGVRQETVSRVESGKHVPNVATVDKLDRALREAGV